MITITIKTDNAAFEDDRGAEVARILRDLAAKFENDGKPWCVIDLNGNRVGTVKLTRNDR